MSPLYNFEMSSNPGLQRSTGYGHLSELSSGEEEKIDENGAIEMVELTKDAFLGELPSIITPRKRSLSSRRTPRYWNCCIIRGINLHRSDYLPENEFSGAREGWLYIYEIIFESSTFKGQLFDLCLFSLICISVATAVLDSVVVVQREFGSALLVIELVFTLIFTLEYMLRIACIKYPNEYILSFMGIVDLASIVPTYIATCFPSARPLLHLAVLRFLRVLRVFRVLKLVRFVDEAQALSTSMEKNKHRIAVFLFTVFAMILVLGCAMYLIEGEPSGFESIPVSLYWTVVTLTTVGYGDITPQTIPGRLLATLVMLAGYGIIACPLVLSGPHLESIRSNSIVCTRCNHKDHELDANFCRHCGEPLQKAP